MEYDMCQTRQEIIDADPKLQKAQKELRRLERLEGNGAVRREILEYETLFETRIAGIQTSQDVQSIKRGLVKMNGEYGKYPSLLYQLLKLPLMGWSIAGTTILFMWLVGQLGPDLIIQVLGVVGFDVATANVNVAVAVVAALLFLNGVRRYIDHVKEVEETSGSLAS